MTFKCPNCKSEFKTATEALEGDQVTCPVCKTQFMNEGSTVVNEGLDDGPPPIDTPSGSGSRNHASGSSSGAGHTRIGGSRYVKLKPGDEIQGYKLLEMLGAGAMAVVYKATQLSLSRTVALKILPERYADIPTFVERFDLESQALAALNHPNIVTIIDRGRKERTFFFVMEYIDGPTLRQLMSKDLGARDFAKILKQICSALNYAHTRGVVHRDVKPTNIMLNSSREVKIADFGLAGLINEGQQEGKERGTPTRMGTRGYMAPEQIEDPLNVDGRADLYALGVVMYQCLAEEMPGPPPIIPPGAMNDEADPRLDPIVEKCLEPDRDKRYASAAQLLEDVNKYQAELAAAPVCPKCNKENPVRFKACKHCGASLEKFFDVCLKCGVENRIDVRKCLECGAPLKETIEKTNARINNQLDRVRELSQESKFDEALQILDEIIAIQGKAFAQTRKRAEDAKLKLMERRKQHALSIYEEGQRLFETNQVAEAIELWKQVPEDVMDVRETIRQAESWLNQIEAVDDVRSSRIIVKPKIIPKAEPKPKAVPGVPPALPQTAAAKPKSSKTRLMILGGVLLLVVVISVVAMSLRHPTDGNNGNRGALPIEDARAAMQEPLPGPLVDYDCYTFTSWSNLTTKAWGRLNGWIATKSSDGGQRLYDLVDGRMLTVSATANVPDFNTLQGARLILYGRYVSNGEYVALEALGNTKGSRSYFEFRLVSHKGANEVVGVSLGRLEDVTRTTTFKMGILIQGKTIVGLVNGEPKAYIKDAGDSLPDRGRLAIQSISSVSAWRDFKCSTLYASDIDVSADQKLIRIVTKKNTIDLKNSGTVYVSDNSGNDFQLTTSVVLVPPENGKLPGEWRLEMGKADPKTGYRISLVLARRQHSNDIFAYWSLDYRDDFGGKKLTETPGQERPRLELDPKTPHQITVKVKEGACSFAIDGKEQPLRQGLPVSIMKLRGQVYLRSDQVHSRWEKTRVHSYIDYE